MKHADYLAAVNVVGKWRFIYLARRGKRNKKKWRRNEDGRNGTWPMSYMRCCRTSARLYCARQSRRRCDCRVARCDFVAYKLNSTTRTRPDPIGPARTRTDFVGDPHGPNGVSRRPGPQKSPFGSGRARVVEFSCIQTRLLHHFSRSTIFPRRQSCKMAQLFHIWSFLNSSIDRTLSFCETKLLASSHVGLVCLRDKVSACNCTVARSDFIAR